METSYAEFDSSPKPKTNKILVGLLAITCLLLIVCAVLAAVFGANMNSSSDSSSSSSSEYCETTECLKLAADLSQTINTSVDPCHDFYHYVCDGWDDENSWINIRYPQYGAFYALTMSEQETFLDELFYETKPKLVDYSSVEKAQIFFKTCYDADSDEDDELNAFLVKLISNTSFATDTTWDKTQIAAFQNTMSYLTQIHFNTLFTLGAQGEKLPGFVQFFDLWQVYSYLNASQQIDETFVPLYEALFEVNETEAKEIRDLVVAFANKVANISTVSDPAYSDITQLLAMITSAPFGNLSAEFGETEVMNYTKLVYDVYSVSSDDPDLEMFTYLSKGKSYFKNLAMLLQEESPMTIQYYIWTSILYYYIDFQGSFSQSQYEDRTDFCVDRTRDKFPYVFGYILFNKLYNDETYEIASTLAKTVKNDGTKVLIEESTWLDDESKANALKKIENMALYIGNPPSIKDGDNIDEFYKEIQQSWSNGWVSNVVALAETEFFQDNATFWGNGADLIGEWPSDLSDPDTFDGWLTGVNAFYVPTGNWFIIPVTISQPPFLISDSEYPSALTYGGLGVVTGHEMSHGFDPSGSQYDFNGTYVGSIFTNESQLLYDEKIGCFINQYNQIQVDSKNGEAIYDNGTRTITENVADNAGMASSWTAWQSYLEENGDDKLIHGVDFSQEQLFFIGYARVWCSSNRPGSNQNWTDVHSPGIARVIGAVQNSAEFAEAYGCKAGDRMNPTNKCTIW